MSDESRTAQPGAGIHQNHYCDHTDADGKRCPRWGCYGFEESRAITLWYCLEHQPEVYRGLRRHGAA
jgi:hypothetical protein